MPRLELLVVASLLGLCLVPSQAEAREPSSRERTYSRTLGKLLDLKPKGVKALTSKSGAQGVQVRFLGLDVTRLHFRSPQAARAFAKRRSREKSGRQRVGVRGQEILVLRGPRLSNAAFSKRALKAGWAASVRSPSKPTKEGILGPLDAQEAKQEAEEASAKLAAKPKRPSSPKSSPKGAPKTPIQRDPSQALVPPPIPGAELPTVGEGPRRMRRIGLDPGVTPGPARGAPAARGLDLSGRWQTLGRGRVTFRRTGQTKTAEVYEVLCVDFDRPCAPLVGSLVGRRLTLRSSAITSRQVEYLWTPGKVGGRFVRVSGSSELLPSGTTAFWRAPQK